MTNKTFVTPVTLTRFKWSATYELPSGEKKRIEAVAQCTSSEECLRIVERIIQKIGGPKAIQRTIIVKPLDHYTFRPKMEIPAVLLPNPLPFLKETKEEEVEETNNKFISLPCFLGVSTKRDEKDGAWHPFYKALPKDGA